jgi:endonuclease/exonuclease/phosphatase family metal-dependent hydrolase
MSYNIRLDVASDGENAWPNRREFLANQVAFHAPDVIGTQEGLPHQVAWLQDRLPAYGMIGEGRDGGDAGEYSAIFYNRTRLRVEETGTFWLSPTPDRPSKGWDTAIQRICTWARFTDRETGQSFLAFNTHLDHRGAIARAEGLKLISQTIDALNTEKLPFVLTGDFNLTPDEAPVQAVAQSMQDAFTVAPVRLGPAGTFTGFNYQDPAQRRIDYVMVSQTPRVEVLRFATLTDAVDGRYPSDHFAVIAILLL